MNINSGNIKQLIQIFTSLNESRQRDLMNKAIYLEFEQGQEDSVAISKPITEKELKEATSKRIKEAAELLNKMKTFDNEHKAALMVFLNELTDGQVTKEEAISITINSRQLSIEEYLNKILPGTDIEKAKSIVKATKEKTELITK